MAKRSRILTRAAAKCVSEEISKHCRKKRGRCKGPKHKQAIAIGFSICRRKGFHSIPKFMKR